MQIYNATNHEPCKSRPHAGQELVTINGFTFHADREMIPLLTALNAAGLQTYSHCAGHPPGECAWVVLELDSVNVEVRLKADRSQMILSWKPSWLASVSDTGKSDE